ncbi:unnamed protein product [Chrysodeixis includens]|uniref:Uncharacterized protein n=1 Tax=Chrysodeixis includens TaxID=689277 RepID=A0A9P0FQZ1_CHRIL|nr:unnamed protein product [Chrysodeixis includens]
MFTIHEGEIIYKEKYGSCPKQRLYVKPPEQSNLVVLDESKHEEYANVLKKIFLPHGYPDSVSSDYMSYQMWDTAQAFCSTITGILATQEVLRGVGVGDTTATPLAATITWVLKDGCGHIGKIIFAFSHGVYLDAYSKKWRLYADTLNDAAMCIELALPAFRDYTTIVLCISTMMKAIVGVAGGATRAAMTQHHAIRGNLADVSAKDSAQETAVNLVASVAALMIITVFGNSLTVFFTMIVLHITFNYLAVRAVCLRTLNEPRFLQIIETYLRKEMVTTPCIVNQNEPIVFFRLGSNLLDRRLCGFSIKMGHSMKKFVKKHPRARYMKGVQDVFKAKEYVLLPYMQSRKIYVMLRESATINDQLCAYFHAVLFGITICAINDYFLPVYKTTESAERPFSQICHTLHRAEWTKEAMLHPVGRFSLEPSIELMQFLNDIVEKEWIVLAVGLKQTGWDLSKHLLVIEEWRICTSTVVAKIIPPATGHPSVAPRRSSKLITFSDHRGRNINDASEYKAYTIEPDKQLAGGAADTNAEGDESVGRAPIEPTSLSIIPEHKSRHPSLQDDKDDSTD